MKTSRIYLLIDLSWVVSFPRKSLVNFHCKSTCRSYCRYRKGSAFLMLGDISGVDNLFVVCGFTDMRKSIDGLMSIVQDDLKMDPCSNSLYLFCGRRHDRIKLLLWEKDGFVLLYKRLSGTGIYKWPRNSMEVRDLTWKEFSWLMDGLEIDQPKAIQSTSARG